MHHEDPGDKRAPLYTAQIEFLSQAEWDRELADLLDDLTPNDGPNAGLVSLSVAEDSVAYGSWCKVYAVYGESRLAPIPLCTLPNPMCTVVVQGLRGLRRVSPCASAPPLMNLP